MRSGKRSSSHALRRSPAAAQSTKATVILGCLMQVREPAALEQIRDAAKADLIASSIGEAVKLCIEVAASASKNESTDKREFAATTAA